MSEQDRITEARRKLLEKRLKGKKQTSDHSLVTIEKHPIDTPIRASYGQERLWVLQQMKPNSTAYNMVNAVRIKGDLDQSKLSAAIEKVVARHTELRTGFVMEDGHLLQVVDDVISVPLDHVNVKNEADLETSIQAFVSQPFNLAQPPLIRPKLFVLDECNSVLVTVIHHIVSDEWSIDLFWKELALLYADNEQALPQLAIQYTDYAFWQREQSYEKQIAYWQKILADDLPLLALPSDKPRPAVQTFQGNLLTTHFSSDTSQALLRFNEQYKTTLFMTLFAAFNVLLHRYSGQSDIILGTPIANRKYPEVENLIGFFLNTIIIRSDFSEAMLFSDYLDTMRQQTLKAFENSDVPFDHVVSKINPPRDPSYNPVFQAMFVYQDEDAHQPRLSELSLETMTVDAHVSKFDLTLFARLDGEQIEIGLEYNTDLFGLEQCERLLAHYQCIVTSIIDNPNTPISQLNMLRDTERDNILAASVGEHLDYPREALIQDLIQAHSDNTIAVQDEYSSMTYGDLNHRANQLAHYLHSLGVDSNVPVALCIERSSDMLIGILGILKAGGAYVPIDPDYPEDRIKYMLNDSGATIVITQEMLTSQFSETDAKIVALDTNPRIDLQSQIPPEITTTSDQLAYIIYTSGSTGTPKGVRIRHRNLVHSTTARYSFYETPPERFLLLSSFAFDSSIVGIFWTLCAGGTLCLPTHQGERDIQGIAKLIETYQITHLLALPSLYEILLDFATSDKLQSLNTVIVAGEACSLQLVEHHHNLLSACRLYNEYGPTEGTVWSTACELLPDVETVFIGKPIPNMQAYVLDTERQLVPFGIVGELYIGGDGIAEGYHRRPKLTNERFVENPFGEGRLYRTGDLVRYLIDGTLEFIGRADYQVKISGYRIELGEIETAFVQHEIVNEAVVLPIHSQSARDNQLSYDLDALANYIIEGDAEAILAEIEQLDDAEVVSILQTLLGEISS